MSENPSVLSHVSVGCDDLERVVAFYEPVLAVLGIGIVERIDGAAVAFGRAFPEFWVVRPLDGGPASVGNGSHVGFIADAPEPVDASHAAALIAGGRDEGAPGPRPHYGAPYYGCFVRDPDGHKIEAACRDAADEGRAAVRLSDRPPPPAPCRRRRRRPTRRSPRARSARA